MDISLLDTITDRIHTSIYFKLGYNNKNKCLFFFEIKIIYLKQIFFNYPTANNKLISKMKKGSL